MAEKNLTLDWYPVGTGPFMLVENNPNSRMVLARNPNFRGETYPRGRSRDARPACWRTAASTALHRARPSSRAKEAIPTGTSSLQGWYDASGISSGQLRPGGADQCRRRCQLTDEMQQKGHPSVTSVRSSTFYMGFNMLDAVVGGDAEESCGRPVSIALDQEEFISIFMNGRGIPPGPAAARHLRPCRRQGGINRVVTNGATACRAGAASRRSKPARRSRLAHGRNAKSGEPLVLNLDTTGGGVGDKARLDWLTRQFAQIDIQLVVRSTDFNRFQEKIRKGAVQFTTTSAGTPTTRTRELHMFLLERCGRKSGEGRRERLNFRNAEFDRLFAEMKNMENSPQRLAIINRMNRILHDDAPWVHGFHPKTYALAHAWLKNRKPSDVGHNGSSTSASMSPGAGSTACVEQPGAVAAAGKSCSPSLRWWSRRCAAIPAPRAGSARK